jgi:drug/metabolite transporter (DMT)-like permease
MSRRGAVLFLALSVIWGLPYLMIRVAVQHGVDPGTLVFLRTAPAAIVLVPVAWRAGALRAARGHLWWIVVYAFVHFGVPWLLMSSAEQHLSSSITGMLVATTPLLAAIVAKLTRPDEQFGPGRLAGLGLGAVGVALLVGFDFAGSNWKWLAAMGVVVVGYTVGPVILSRRLSGIPGLGVVAIAVSVVAIAYTPYGATHLPTHLTWSVLGALVVLAVVCTAAAFLVMFELVREVGPSRMVVVNYANTAIAVLLGVAVLSEPLTRGILLGFPLILIGSFLATSKKRPINEASPTGAPVPRRSFWRVSRQALPR